MDSSTPLTYFWRFANASGIVCFDTIEQATDWAENMLSHAPTVSIVREA